VGAQLDVLYDTAFVRMSIPTNCSFQGDPEFLKNPPMQEGAPVWSGGLLAYGLDSVKGGRWGLVWSLCPLPCPRAVLPLFRTPPFGLPQMPLQAKCWWAT
jgi:hypothetical protein